MLLIFIFVIMCTIYFSYFYNSNILSEYLAKIEDVNNFKETNENAEEIQETVENTTTNEIQF